MILNNYEPDYKSMFEMAVSALARIDAAMGMPEDGLNNPERTITAIKLLHAKNRDDEAEIIRLRSELMNWKI